MNNQDGSIPQSKLLVVVVMLVIMLLVTGCGAAAPSSPSPTPVPPTPTPVPPTPTPQPPAVTLVVNPPDIKDVLPGQTVPLNADASGGSDLSFNWTVTNGTLSSADAPAVIYTAPYAPGIDVVTVVVKSSGGTTTKSVSFNVVTPDPPTDTPTPVPVDTATPTLVPTPPQADTATPTPTSVALECRHPALTSYIFPQLKDVAGQRAFYGPVEESPEVFLCGGVRDIVHSDPVSVKVEYHIARGTGKLGYFGIGTLGGYDATQFSQLCMWAYTLQPDQAFRLRIRDQGRY